MDQDSGDTEAHRCPPKNTEKAHHGGGTEAQRLAVSVSFGAERTRSKNPGSGNAFRNRVLGGGLHPPWGGVWRLEFQHCEAEC